jgi:hypothetical protein
MHTPLIRLVMPPVWPGVFTRIGAAFAASLRTLGFHVEAVEGQASAGARLNIVLGWSVYTPAIPAGAEYVVLQQEPLRREPWPARVDESANLFRGARETWEYSQHNLGLIPQGRERWMPLRRSPEAREDAPAAAPNWDVLFAGVLTPRREHLLRELSLHCCVSAKLRWGADLDDALSRAKLVLNVHGGDSTTPLEQPRVWHALERGCLVVTEESVDEPYAGLATAPYERLARTALELLHDAPQRERRRRDALAAFREAPSMVETLGAALKELDIEAPEPTGRRAAGGVGFGHGRTHPAGQCPTPRGR